MPRNVKPYKPLGELPTPCFFTFKDQVGTVFMKTRSISAAGGPTDVYGIAYQPTEDGNSVHIVQVGTGKLIRALARLSAREEPEVAVWGRLDNTDRILEGPE